MIRFLPALALAALVIVTAPFMGVVRDVLFEAFASGAVRALAAALALVALALFVFALWRIRRRRLWRYGGLAVVALLLWVQAVGFRSELAQVVVAEKIHILEYGLLAFLLYRAWRPAGDLRMLLLPLLWVVVAGTLEEGVQWWSSTRTGEIRDVALNALSGLCGLVFALSLEPPERFSWRLGRDGRRRLGDVAALAVGLVGLFVYHVHLGYWIEDPEIGRFRSWHARAELLEMAAERAREWAVDPPAELSPWRREDFYLTEAGWHAMHRNASYERGFYRLAQKANAILETYYGPYLDLDGFRGSGPRRYSPEAVADLAAKASPIAPAAYVSPVLESRILTWPPKPVFVALWLPLAALVWLLPRLRRS